MYIYFCCFFWPNTFADWLSYTIEVCISSLVLLLLLLLPLLLLCIMRMYQYDALIALLHYHVHVAIVLSIAAAATAVIVLAYHRVICTVGEWIARLCPWSVHSHKHDAVSTPLGDGVGGVRQCSLPAVVTGDACRWQRCRQWRIVWHPCSFASDSVHLHWWSPLCVGVVAPFQTVVPPCLHGNAAFLLCLNLLFHWHLLSDSIVTEPI